MKKITQGAIFLLLIIVSSFGFVSAQEGPVVLTLAAYTTPREAYGTIIPLFQAQWAAEHDGQQVIFQESYLGSGAQSRAVAGGFEADIVALSLENDVKRLVDAGLITHDWKANPYGGIVSASEVVLVVRPGNPKGIADWADLAKEGVEVITPDAATSGGARWNVMGAYGAAFRGHVEGYEATQEGATQFLKDLFTNVSVMDPGARESVLTFVRGIGDVAITYENEYYASLAAGDEVEVVYPSSTLLIENPVAVVDSYVDKHGTREAAEAFVNFLYTPEAQAAFNEAGYRPPVPVAVEGSEATPEPVVLDEERFPTIEDQFTIADFGGWEEVTPAIFGDEGIYTLAIAEVKGQ